MNLDAPTSGRPTGRQSARQLEADVAPQRLIGRDGGRLRPSASDRSRFATRWMSEPGYTIDRSRAGVASNCDLLTRMPKFNISFMITVL
ncbi:hypothetical protein PUN4_990028 [Paraburkholderia unamae]|nr:hypothetical protein PUN4_990028 [Paraburkholderia unamae]